MKIARKLRRLSLLPLRGNPQRGSMVIVAILVALGATTLWVSQEQTATVQDLKQKNREKLVEYAKARNQSLLMASQKLLAMRQEAGKILPGLYPTPYFLPQGQNPTTTFKAYKVSAENMWKLNGGTQIEFQAPTVQADSADWKSFFQSKTQLAPPGDALKTYINFDSLVVDVAQAELITHAYVTAETHVPIEGSKQSLVVKSRSRIAVEVPPPPQIRVDVNCGNGQVFAVDSATATNPTLVTCNYVDPTGNEQVSYQVSGRGIIYRVGLDTGDGMKYALKKSSDLAENENFQEFSKDDKKLSDIIALPDTKPKSLADEVAGMDLKNMKFETTCSTPSTTEVTNNDVKNDLNSKPGAGTEDITGTVRAEALGPGPGNLVQLVINLKADITLSNPPKAASESSNEKDLRVAIWEHLRKNGPDPMKCCDSKCGGCPTGCFPLFGWFNNHSDKVVSSCPGFTSMPNSWINPTRLICSNKAGFELFAFNPFDNCSGGKIGSRSGSCGCFAPETKIWMADGSKQAIRDIREGDYVYNPILKKPVRVKEVIKGPEKVELFAIGYGEDKVVVTGTHPFPTRTGMKAAYQLELGEEVLGPNQEWRRIETLDIQAASENAEVWNIRLDTTSADEQERLVWADGIVTGDLGLQEKISAKAAAKR